MALHPALRMEALYTEAPHEALREALREALHEAPCTEALHEALYTKALHDGSAYDGSVLFCLVGVEKPCTGHFILIDCDILCIFYWIRIFYARLFALSKTTLSVNYRCRTAGSQLLGCVERTRVFLLIYEIKRLYIQVAGAGNRNRY